MKTILHSIGIFTLLNLAVQFNSEAQIYSSAFNTITGTSFTGINTNNPGGYVHIFEPANLLAGGNNSYSPLLRFEGQTTYNSQIANHKWDFRMDESSSLTVWHHQNNNSANEIFQFNPEACKFFNKLKIGNNQEIGSGITPNGTQGYFMSFGLEELGTNGGWNGSGATIFSNSDGQFQIMTNPSGTIGGTSNMLNNVRFSIDETNGYFSTPIRIGGAFADENILQSGYFLYVKKGIRTEKVVVDYYNTWADYVFEEDYELRSLEDLKRYVMTNKHLPRVPAASEIAEKGIDLGEMNAILIEKVEELTLYLIDLEERLKEVEESKNK